MNKIKPETPKTPLFTGVSPVFELLKAENDLVVTLRGKNWNTLQESLERIAKSNNNIS